MRSTPLQTEAAGAAPPDAFGPFRVLHQIGAGALGPVFRAYDPDQDRLVAVKLFQLDLTPERTPQLVALLQKLIDADLAHPSIAAPLAAGFAGASVYLAQDFVAADSLDVVTREFGKASVADAVRVASQLAGALDFAAEAGFRHGTLHPRDVLLTSDDARLTGIGVAQAVEALGLRPPIRRPYAAPERAAGQTWDRRGDVFSLAVLIAEMLNGRRVTGTGARALEGAAEWDVEEKSGLRDAFAKAMAERPGDRFATATEFADALKHATAGTATLAASPSLEPPTVVMPASATRPQTLLEPRLPLDEPAAAVLEELLPGDAPRDASAVGLDSGIAGRSRDAAQAVEDDTVWDPPLLVRAADTHSPEPTIERPRADVPATPDYQLRTRDLPTSSADVIPIPIATPVVEPPSRVAAAATADAPNGRFDGPRDVAQSAVWPISLALTVGLVVGVAIGFFVFADRLGRGGPAPEPSPAVVSASPATAAPPEPRPVAAATPVAPRPPSEAASTPTPAPARPVERPAPAASASTRSAEPAATRRDAAAAPVAGRLLVRSSPAGARVTLDSKDVGVTPLTLRSLPIGRHALRVTQDGYLTEDRSVILTAAQPAQSLIVDLVRRTGAPAAARSAATGTETQFAAPLIVESLPAGAQVFMDGRPVGTTPLTLDAIPTGSHALRLELDGYRRWTASVRVAAGQRNRVTASLEQ